MKRQPLIVWLAAALAAGVLARGWLALPVLAVLLAGGASALALAAARPPAVRLGASLALFACLGLFVGSLALLKVETSYLGSGVEKEPFLTVEGIVAGDPAERAGAWSFPLRVRQIVFPDRVETDELLTVTLRGDGARPRLGERLRLSGRARPACRTKELREVMLRRRVGGSLAAYHPLAKKLPSRNRLLSHLYRFRSDSAAAVATAMGRDESGVLRGVLLGDRSGIDDELNEQFGRSGLAHVLAVSGLHVGLLAGIVLGAARLLRLGARGSRFLLGLSVGAYGLMTGAHASVLRAGIMLFAALAVWLLSRPRDPLATVAVTALALLAYDPLYAYDAGCQLSFGAVVAIVVLGPRLEPYLAALPPWLARAVNPAIAAQLGLAPLLAAYFNQVSLVAPLANAAVVPATGLGLGSGLVAAVLRPLLPVPAPALFAPAALVFKYIVTATRLFASLPLAALSMPAPTMAHGFLYYAWLAWFVSRPLGGEVSTVPALAGALAALVIAAAFRSAPPVLSAAPRLSVRFLDVGQGDATLLTGSGKTVLVDGGPSPSRLVSLLASHRVDRLDVLAVTHDHADHVAGLQRVPPRIRVGTLLVSRLSRPAGPFRRLIARLKARGTSVRSMVSGDEVHVGNGLKLQALYPLDGQAWESGARTNNTSLVLRAVYGRFRLLLTGDVESEAESRMCRARVPLMCDVLKVAHHGSDRGSGLSFLSRASPSVAVISVGEGNRFGHPAPSALRRLLRCGVRLFRTDRQGEVEVTTDGGQETVVTER